MSGEPSSLSKASSSSSLPKRPSVSRTSSETNGDEDLETHPLPDEQKAMVVEKYLARPEDAIESDQQNPSLISANSSHISVEDEYQAPHNMVGGAITEDVYRWAHQKRPRRTKRSESMHLPSTSGIDVPFDKDVLKQPGGFRRSYILTQAAEQGKPPPRALKSFVEFLMLYGHFAGEELNEDEFIDEEDLEAGAEGQPSSSSVQHDPTETSHLLEGRQVHGSIPSYRGYRRHQKKGEASVLDAVLMLLKSFVGTGILFLGKAFFNGGILFSTVLLSLIAAVSLWSFLLLVETNQKLHVGFGEMGGVLYGRYMRNAILTSIVVSQLGFVAAYTVFVAENTQSLILSMTQCRQHVSTGMLIFIQALIFLPLSLVRKIAKLSWTALVADVFILAGIVYLFYYEIGTLMEHGLADVQLFNRNNFPLFIGTAVFTFEGIGLVIPITESMREPEKFPMTITGVMIAVTTLFASSGFFSYAAFGSDIQTVVITNMPGQSRFVQAIQAFYSLAILLSMPLQLFPALTILELGLFKRSGKYSFTTKMRKNFFRFGIVVVAMMTAWMGANDLDKFVSLVGSVACVPLCFVYPPLLHFRACATTRRAKMLDMALLVFGVSCVLFAGSQTLNAMLSSSPPKHPVCTPPDM
ncbi:hypothetical protein MNAN1_002250 [Malassezia nana]|uniref:Amino acid transporter transmembrane domain-containing protein n=1 Tax=Malassezia nana TaxID=180528 RepID=A0AAF0EMG7_9BASI|nr:hypothetical protein MNAN1_002250 [Malassezia nana]